LYSYAVNGNTSSLVSLGVRLKAKFKEKNLIKNNYKVKNVSLKD